MVTIAVKWATVSQELSRKYFFTIKTFFEVFQNEAKKIIIFRQKIYDNITLSLLQIKIIKPLVLSYHKGLFYFRYFCERAGCFVEHYVALNTFALLLSIICSRLHIAGYMIVACLILIRLDFTVAMLRFYKPRMELAIAHFPQLNQLNRCGMWTSAFKALGEAASNPQVQAVGVAVTGALAWKALDVYDTLKQADIAQADRDAVAIQAQAQIECEEREKDRQAGNRLSYIYKRVMEIAL